MHQNDWCEGSNPSAVLGVMGVWIAQRVLVPCVGCSNHPTPSMGLYDHVEFSTDFPLPNCSNPAAETFQTHDWVDELRTLHVDARGRVWYRDEALRRNTSADTSKHPDSRLSGFNAAAETVPVWRRLDYNGTMGIVGKDAEYELVIYDGIVRKARSL